MVIPQKASIYRFNRPNSESFVFLLSTRAGGLGIRLGWKRLENSSSNGLVDRTNQIG